MKNISTYINKNLLTTSIVIGITLTVSIIANADVSDIVDGARFYVGAGIGSNHYGLHGDFKKTIENNVNKASAKVNSADLLRLKKYTLGVTQLSGAFFEAANTNRDINSLVNSADLLKLKKYILSAEMINQY